jgi:hypothetical protein
VQQTASADVFRRERFAFLAQTSHSSKHFNTERPPTKNVSVATFARTCAFCFCGYVRQNVGISFAHVLANVATRISRALEEMRLFPVLSPRRSKLIGT